MTFSAPYPPYDPTDTSGFSYETVVKRWPIIITGVIDHLHQTCHALSLNANAIDDSDGSGAKQVLLTKIAEGTGIIEKISKLKYEMARDRALEYLPNDAEASVAIYNTELAQLEKDNRHTWFTAPWLFAECYLYRLLRSFFLQTEHWRSYDPFYGQKIKTFQHSGTSILHLAATMHELEAETEVKSDPEKLKVLFNEMIQMCLWGNATDLSLLTHLTQADIQHLQSVGKEAQTARQQFILKDDQEAVWEHIQTLQDARIDFVLDNSGFELFTDLVFADFLVTFTPYISKVVFHPKLIPWFVSDVTPPDFKDAFSSLLDPSFFPPDVIKESGLQHLKHMVTRWSSYVARGIFSLSVPLDTPLGGNAGSTAAEFWTTPRPYWDMETEAPDLFATLNDSGLVIFKGDLNFRKLTGDVAWPAWTPFATAIGPLAGSFPLLSLRTNKADVVVGVKRDIAEKLDQSGEKWRVDGRYALISFLPRS